MNARQYYRSIQAAISESPHIIASDMSFNQVDVNECYVRGVLTLTGGFELHVAEYVITEPDVRRSKYRYHLQRADGTLVVHWDNVPHHRNVSSFPNHRHNANQSVHSSAPMDVFQVLTAVIPLITSPDDK